MNNTKKKIAILVERKINHLLTHVDDILLNNTFKKMGHDSEIVFWDDNTVDYSKYDGAIIRSCWDYDKRLKEFLNRMREISKQTTLFNSYEIISVNTDKRYLLDLQKKGVPIVPTIIVNNLEDIKLLDNWSQVIVKPTVSASGRDTSLHNIDNKQDIIDSCRAIVEKGKIAMIQQYQKSVEQYGERSSVIIAGEITFTMKKTPKSGGFLVHTHHGGKYIPVDITLQEQKFINLLLSKLEQMPLYMRVDYLKGENNNIHLLELEQIEPNLYLNKNKKGLMLLTKEMIKRI